LYGQHDPFDRVNQRKKAPLFVQVDNDRTTMSAEEETKDDAPAPEEESTATFEPVVRQLYSER